MSDIDDKILKILAVGLLLSFILDGVVLKLVQGIDLNENIFFLFKSSVIILLFVGLTVWFFKDEKSRKVILPFWASAVIAYGLSFIIKLIISKPRFFIEKFYPLGIPNYSFPSSHVTIAFAVLPLLILKTKKFKWYWLGYACLVLLSRILLKQHYLSDVMAGAMLGYGTGLLVLYFIKKYKITKI